jgi:DNA-binding XRE family transcriptional regulator
MSKSISNLQSEKLILDPDECLAFGAFVRAGRNALGISQNGLAAMLGVHRTTLVRMEKGLPPLRRGLCESAIVVFAKAGVTFSSSTVGDPNRAEEITEIKVTVLFESLRKAQRIIQSGNENTELLRQLLGEDFKPPLEEKPLRRK